MYTDAASNTQIETELVSQEPTRARRIPVKVRVEYSHVEDFLVDYTSNHTIGGMFIKTDRPLNVGARFVLRFQLPGTARAIETEAQVRWTLPVEVAAPMTPGMGVRFAPLSSQDKCRVEELLESWR
jgi:type IV pilus assembly protein PilZ